MKKMASNVLGIGIKKIKIIDPKKAIQAMTKDDVRLLIRQGIIQKKPFRGTSRVRARKIAAQKKKGRRKGTGKRKGTEKTRTPEKKVWMKKVRALRRKLNELKKGLKKGKYRKIYRMIKGGYFRDKSHLQTYVEKLKA